MEHQVEDVTCGTVAQTKTNIKEHFRAPYTMTAILAKQVQHLKHLRWPSMQ